MRARLLVVIAVVSVCLCSVVAAQDEELPLANWSAPPYWNPAVQAGTDAESGRGMLARAEGMRVQAEALPSSPLPFVAIQPCRIVDTRVALDDGFHRPNFADDESRMFPFPLSPTCTGLPATAGAWSVNIQFRSVSQLSFLTAYPTGTTMPGVSTMTASPAAWVQNGAIVPAGTGGAIDIYCQYAGRVVIDINGYYGPQSVVTSLNTKIGDVTLAQGNNVTITPSGQTLTIAATGGPGGELPVGSTTQTLRHNGSAWTASSALTNDGTNIAVSGRLNLALTTATSGQVLVAGTPFLHAFGANNTFLGLNAGNFTMTGVGANVAIGDQSLHANTDGADNTAVGALSLGSNTAGSLNTAVGFKSLTSNTTACGNTAVGLFALAAQSYDNGGIALNSNNTAVGTSALTSNQPTSAANGIQNTAVGALAMLFNTTGAYNTASGAESLYYNRTASNNTAIGYRALYTQSYANGGTMWVSDNTAVGYEALNLNEPTNNSNGFRNTAVGSLALRENTTGLENTAAGFGSSHWTTTGFQNTAIGVYSLAFNTTGNYNTAVGWYALGDNSTGGGNIAIGHNAGTGFNGDNQLFIGNGLGTLIWGDIASKRVAIGMTNGSYQLQLAADSAGKPNGGSWANSSDARLKRSVAPLSGALQRILQLQGVSFEWINPGEHGGQAESAGFIAQDVERVFPEWVTMIEPAGADRGLVAPGERVRSLSLPFGFDAYLVEALREQQTQIEALRADRDKQLARVETLERRLAVLEASVRVAAGSRSHERDVAGSRLDSPSARP